MSHRFHVYTYICIYQISLHMNEYKVRKLVIVAIDTVCIIEHKLCTIGLWKNYFLWSRIKNINMVFCSFKITVITVRMIEVNIFFHFIREDVASDIVNQKSNLNRIWQNFKHYNYIFWSQLNHNNLNPILVVGTVSFIGISRGNWDLKKFVCPRRGWPLSTIVRQLK